ncbi:MAG TPA: hypothetical protein VLZ30_03965 [Verrucomicrobiae bacterium]|nr:hypothetical protein [Verrucomicrobiae bacterium]
MKRNIAIVLAFLLGASRLIAAESPGPTMGVVPNEVATGAQKPELPKFDLDFPGGTPGQLVQAISKASGHSLNAIIPKESAEVMLPPLKLRHVDAAQLFGALSAASHKAVHIRSTNGGYSDQDSSYGFRCEGKPDQDSVWHFHNTRLSEPPPANWIRFYQLNPYLETYSIESITTAIETGWKMLGIATPPKLSFHKDTGLLIAVGEPDGLRVIDDMLQNLPFKKPDSTPKTPGANPQ